MKTAMSILFILLVFFVSAQEFPPEKWQDFDWGKWEVKLSDSKKMDYLKKLIDSKYFEVPYFKTASDELKKYHLIDLDGDTRMDVIYAGRNPGGIETNNIAFFLNNGDSLELVVKLNGNIIELKRKDSKSALEFKILKSPCCAGYIYELEHYKFCGNKDCFEVYNPDEKFHNYSYSEVNNSKFCASLIAKYTYVNGLEIPGSIAAHDTLTTMKKVFLTIKPGKPDNINFNEQVDFSFGLHGNKAISVIDSGIQCVILSKKKGENQEGYYFIMLKNTNKINNYLSAYPGYHYGWVTSDGFK